MSDFPASKTARGALFARAGLKVGANYAKYYANRALGGRAGADKSALHRDNADDLFRRFTQLRGTALKLAQSLSLDTGVLPDEFVEVMSQAQYRVPPMNRALVRRRLRDELGDYPEKLFARFETEALAAASIGQVHRAETRDGVPVAVKIQYPDVRRTIESDLSMARLLFGRLVGERVDDYFAEIRDKLLEETDYGHESRQLLRFAADWDDPAVVLPRPLPELSSARVLTMTFVEGSHLDAYLAGGPTQTERDAYGQLLWDFFHRQIAAGRYTLHADLHPGNFLFRADGRLGVIDFGCVKEFPPDFIDLCLRLLRQHCRNDEADLKALYREARILDQNQEGPVSEEEAFAYFRSFGLALSHPYREESCDFGDPDYRRRINDFFRRGPDLKPQVSRHFIFLNKVQAGLYSLLMKLGARVDTRYSRRVIEGDAVLEKEGAQQSGVEY